MMVPVWFLGPPLGKSRGSPALDQDPQPVVSSILYPAIGVGIPLLPDTLGGRTVLSGKERDYNIDFHQIQNGT
jgi:hypothetical protein